MPHIIAYDSINALNLLTTLTIKNYFIGFIHSDLVIKNDFRNQGMNELFHQLDLNNNLVIEPTEVDESLIDIY